MEAYLQGQDLWDLIAGDEAVIPTDNPQNAELRKEYIEHVRDLKSPKQLWETLERLFTQKNTMWLQFLENELAGMIQVSDARLRRYLIRGLRKEFMPFISSIQGWAKQPSIIELENLLFNQEALKEQMLHMKIMNLSGNNAYSLKILINRSIDEGLSLKDVYHVPGLKKNLASVSQIMNSGRYVLFGPNNVQILSNVKHIEADILFTGKRKESLYVLSANDAYVEKTCQNASAALWHARLGHIGYQLLQKISSQKLLDGIPIFKDFHHDMVCSGCQYGKSQHLPFSNSKNRASTMLQLIHSDLMGPTKTPSYNGL
uniref:GAG-pre-integrase domain-containing protein n=1 Tax=Nelumbo nucifera TaxID=4432 RepID=A0A822YG53_NELNU|nr:TPA_asm: hypothetical protein HUJ06_031423 [Nelumbo nucifera]